MNKLIGALMMAALMVPIGAGAQTPTGTGIVSMGPEDTGPVSNTTELVVEFRDGTSSSTIADVASELHLHFAPNSHEASEDGIYLTRVQTSDMQRVLTRLRSEPSMEAAEENRVMHADFVPNDPLYPQQWGLARVGTESSWDVTCGRGVTVAVIDTGVACEDHEEYNRLPDLAGTHCVPGWNFINDNEHANDDHGHGTHVAGTIAQTTDNALGGAGIAYCVSIMPVKVLSGSGSGTLAGVADGIRWASDHGAQVINLSLGGGEHSSVMEAAVQHARNHGTVVICAAGNNGRYVESPALENGAVAVSALGPTDDIASFSSRGPEIFIGAPGVGILQQTICEHGENRCVQFASWSGTSMASPHVAGVAALIVSMGVTDPAAVEATLARTASAPANNDTTQEL